MSNVNYTCIEARIRVVWCPLAPRLSMITEALLTFSSGSKSAMWRMNLCQPAATWVLL